MNPALFLDRDGVIIENRSNYVRTWSDVSIYPQAVRALEKIEASEYKIFILTNQSVVGRGIISHSTADKINKRLVEEIESAGGRVDGVFMCPHTPDENCPCRKPKPGMILEAAASSQLDLSKSILIGDALSDIIAGQTAGIGQNVLVYTGRGLAQSKLPSASQIPPFLVFEDLLAALSDLIP
ncbi:MAG: HAD family hydrolase [Chloroflexi bacterium]|nr:HAD family hydrolase [Chloroflexota bacterium]